MSYQRSGIMSNGLPSLYDEVAATDATEKSLSILSAVTGKEVPKSAAPNKNAMPARTMFLYLLFISTMLGFAYWQYSHTDIGTWFAQIAGSNPVGQNPQHVVTTPAVAKAPAPPVKIDAARIEKITEKPTILTSLHSPSSDKTTPDGTTLPAMVAASKAPEPSLAKTVSKTPAVVVAAKKPAPSQATHHPASQPESPALKNPEAKKVSNIADASKVKRSPPAIPPSKTVRTIPQAMPKKTPLSTKAAEPAQRTAVIAAHTDPDEKLLEGMLRLMKRERTKDVSPVRSAK